MNAAESLQPTVAFLREHLQPADVLLILGSGLGALGDRLEDAARIAYSEIHGFPVAAVEGHRGALVSGVLEGVRVCAMQGRFHLYEGWSPDQVAIPIRAISAGLGTRTLLVTNAAGGMRQGMRSGDLMLLSDHLNLMFRNPLTGPVFPGERRFPDLSQAYDPELRRKAMTVAAAAGIGLTEGVYAGLLGPSYETPAEVRMLGMLGADAVGMSTVPEVIVARARGMRVLGLSCITNVAAGLSDQLLSHDEVIEVGSEAAGRLEIVVRGVLRSLGEQ